jgi:TolA-binding protein
MKYRLIAYLLLAFLFTSCGAYFNTFYNTKKYFDEARKEREKRLGDTPTSNELAKYNQTIEKASKILELHPDSKYVDDAVMILGQCFFHKGEYVQAGRKFEELITFFPTSSYFGEAHLWLGKTKIQMKDYAGARFQLQEFVNNTNFKKELREECQFYLGEIQFEQGYFLEAEQEYKKAAENAGDKTVRAKSYFQLGQSQIEIQDYSQAVVSFRQAIKHAPEKRFLFEAKLSLGAATKFAGEFRDATNILSELLTDQTMRDRQGYVKLELADCLYREGKALQEKLQGADVQHLGKIEQALDEYKKISLEFKKTEVAAQAFFEIARIYEEDFGDFASAKEYYEKVKLESTKSEFVPASIQKAKDIADLIRLKSLVKKSQGEQADRKRGGYHAMTDLELLLLEHGVHPELRFIKAKRKAEFLALANEPKSEDENGKAATADDANEADGEDLDVLLKNKLQLAEIYLFQFSQIDSAMLEYNEIIELFPNHSACAKALFSNALIYENEYLDKFKTDSLLYAVIERFPDSKEAQEARKILNLPLVVNRNEIASDLYKSAESSLFADDISKAAQEFQKLCEYFPNSEYAPKALFALGWIYEKKTNENEKALHTYNEIVEKYPDSEYSKTVKRKIDEVEKAAKLAEAEKQKAVEPAPNIDTVMAADSTLIQPAVDSTRVPPAVGVAPAQADSLLLNRQSESSEDELGDEEPETDPAPIP